jgi:hypothetical protein
VVTPLSSSPSLPSLERVTVADLHRLGALTPAPLHNLASTLFH